jgi:two-component system phosphate regulon response regulator OmpR
MDNKAAKILIVDDDSKLRALLVRYLGDEGFSVAGVGDGPGMDAYLENNRVDLIVLDLMLPGEDGLSIARRLQSTEDVPIIIISARGEEVDRIVGLEVGADDYLPKPFNPRELLARTRAVLRRFEAHAASDQAVLDHQQFRFGDFTLDLVSHSLVRKDAVIELTPGDFALLEAFLSSPNRLLSRDSLIKLLKGYERAPYDRSIDVRVTRLRRKIEPDHEHPQYIRTVWGRGYMFTPNGNNAAS